MFYNCRYALSLIAANFMNAIISFLILFSLTYHGLSLDTFEENTACCLLLEVSRLSLGALNGFELLLTGLWLLIQVFVFICTSDALVLEGEAGDGESLHIEPCLLSETGEKKDKTINYAPQKLRTNTRIHKVKQVIMACMGQ